MITSGIKYSVRRTKRRSIAIRVERDGSVTVFAPYFTANDIIQQSVMNNVSWILKKQAEVLKFVSENAIVPFTEAELADIKLLAAEKIPPVFRLCANVVDVEPKKLTLRPMVSKWGSCSSRGHVSINTLLALAPDNVMRYIVIHELCHLKHMDHSKSFKELLYLYCPDHEVCDKWLSTEGVVLSRRLRESIVNKNGDVKKGGTAKKEKKH